MYISIDRDSSEPVYMQIYREMRSRIISGAFVQGAKLPSKRELAADCFVSVVTVEHAYQLLCDEGFCEMRRRSGCYVKYSPDSFFTVSAENEDGSRERSALAEHNENIPFSSVAAMLRKVILDYGERILMKSPMGGCLRLREAICRYLSRCRSISVSSAQVIIGSGAEYLYGVCIQMLGRNKTVALESPSYEKIRAVYTAHGAVCDMLEMDSEGIRTDELDGTNAEILHVTPFNSFPSRITASAERRRAYLEWANKRNAVIIEDDYDSEFTLNGKAPQTLFAQTTENNVIYINTFSKTIAPSLRAGYMVLPKNLLPLYEKTVGFYSCTVPMLEQYFLAEWLDSGEFERTINRTRNSRGSPT
ncbi:MAG: PLP-dependent aminotransferase family protein [Ruminococcus sp.]|nr:PLP-dependent aminotransferase family protein [Ruminococcus sp.]